MGRRDVDVAVIGGGLAGSALAAVLTARGIDVALCDLHATYPADFRAEKLSAEQVRQLCRLGLWDHLRPQATAIESLAVARFGQVVEERPNDEFGIDYADLVNAVRARVPAAAMVHGRVCGLESSLDRQLVRLSDGREIAARLAVVATGLGRGLLDGVGIRRVVVQDEHCLAIGFDLRPGRTSAARLALTYFGERPSDRSAYLTLFPIADRLRANLFVYRRRDEAWTRDFRDRPAACLAEMMPGLRPMLGGIEILGRPVVRPIDLYESAGHQRDGIALIGDAFATTCPTGGTGINKVLTDAERLAAHIPDWLATPGMGVDKIATFYADPAKRACDQQARRMIDYARGMALAQGPVWAARRLRNFWLQRLRYQLRLWLAPHPTSL